MTATWSGRYDQARDAVWAAWRRLDLEPYDMEFSEEPPTPLSSLADVIGAAIVEPTTAVLDEFDGDFDADARRRIIGAVAIKSVRHVAWAVVEAVAREAARPVPLPFEPPSAGSWVRARTLARPAVRRLRARPNEWDGAWHRFSGDLERAGRVSVNDVHGRAACGVRLRLRWFTSEGDRLCGDYVLADDRPGVDACRRCEPMRSRLRLVTA